MEVVAILLPALLAPVVAVLLVVAGVRRSAKVVAVALSWVLFTTAALAGPWLPRDTGTPAGDGLRVAVANTLPENVTPDQAARDVRATGADVVVVPEASPAVHARLSTLFRFAVRAPDRYTAAIGVYADVPIEQLDRPRGLPDEDRNLRVRVRPGGDVPTFVLWALHLPRPWFTDEGDGVMRPGGHAYIVDAYLDAIRAETEPVVVMGDLNSTDRGRAFHRISDGRRDAMAGIRGSYTSLKRFFRPLLLRIDHVLEPTTWCADGQHRFHITGSDHRGVTARIGPCR